MKVNESNIAALWKSMNSEKVNNEKVFDFIKAEMLADHIIATNNTYNFVFGIFTDMSLNDLIVFTSSLDIFDLCEDFFEVRLECGDKFLADYSVWNDDYIRAFFEDNVYRMDEIFLARLKAEVKGYIQKENGKRYLNSYLIMAALNNLLIELGDNERNILTMPTQATFKKIA